MAQILNYKNLLNTFVDESKAYSLDVKNRLNNLFLYHSMGVVEEAMSSRNFYVGILGDGNGNLVGIPKKLIGRISNYYTTLKENISADTITPKITAIAKSAIIVTAPTSNPTKTSFTGIFPNNLKLAAPLRIGH